MALPTLLQRTEISREKETMEIMKDQKESLAKISETLISNRKDYGSLRKDMQDIKSSLIESVESFSELKKYFEKSNNLRIVEEKKLNIKESENKGFFSRAISKLLGKGSSDTGSDLQTKMYDEVKRTRAFAENTDRAIQFIRRSYEPAQKEKDYEKLAKLIGEEIEATGGGSAIGGIALAVGKVGTALIEGVRDVVLKLIGAVTTLLVAKGMIPDADIDIDRDGRRRRAPGKDGRVLVPGDVPDLDRDKGKGTSGAWKDKLSEYGKRLSDVLKAAFAAVAGFLASKLPWLKNLLMGAVRGFPGGPWGIGAGILTAIAGTILSDKIGPGEETMKENEKIQAENRRAELQKQMDEEYERKQRLYQSEEFKNDRDAVAKEFMESKIDAKAKQDILSIRDDEERYNKMLEALQNQKSETVSDKTVDGVVEYVEKETKDVIDKLKEKLENIAGEALEATSKEIVGFLDNMKLPIGDGETIDILPGLGTFLGKELTDLTDSVKDLASDKSDAVPQNVSMVTQNNIGANKSAPIAFPSPVVRDTDPAVALYKTRAALV